jgi:hypothetical protein
MAAPEAGTVPGSVGCSEVPTLGDFATAATASQGTRGGKVVARLLAGHGFGAALATRTHGAVHCCLCAAPAADFLQHFVAIGAALGQLLLLLLASSQWWYFIALL